MDSFSEFLETGIVPEFPSKGKFPIWSKSWAVVGYGDNPQYSGSQPLRYPPEWTPFMCHFAHNAAESQWRDGPS